METGDGEGEREGCLKAHNPFLRAGNEGTATALYGESLSRLGVGREGWTDNTVSRACLHCPAHQLWSFNEVTPVNAVPMSRVWAKGGEKHLRKEDDFKGRNFLEAERKH